MSVVTSNPFALLDDEDGPKPAAASKPAKGAGATPKAAAGAGAETGAKRSAGPASRGGRYYQRGGGGGAKPAPRDEVTEEGPDGTKRFDGEKARRGGTRGRGRGEGYRGGRGGGGGGRGARVDRPDRRSATGIIDSEKKVHQGWGGDTGDGEQLAEAQGEADAVNDWAGGGGAATGGWDAPAGGGGASGGGDDWGAPATTAEGGAATGANEAGGDAEADKRAERRRRREEEDEEDAKLVTLAEFRKTQASNLEGLVAPLEGRKANDGTDEGAAFKGAVKIGAKADEDDGAYFVGKQKSAPRARTQKEAKQIIEIDGRFERPNRGGYGGGERGGGDRGGDRGGRGRGRGEGRGRGGGEGYRGGRGGPRPGGGPRTTSQSQEVNVDDATAFPSLS